MRSDGYGEGMGSNSRDRGAAANSNSSSRQYDRRSRDPQLTLQESYSKMNERNGQNPNKKAQPMSRGGRNGRRRLDSASSSSDGSSSSSAFGGSQQSSSSTSRPKKKAYRARGCRGGAARRNRRSQRVATDVATAALDADGDAKDQNKHQTSSHRTGYSGNEPHQGQVKNQQYQSPATSLTIPVQARDNHHAESKSFADVFREQKPLGESVVPGLQNASSFASSLSSNSSENEHHHQSRAYYAHSLNAPFSLTPAPPTSASNTTVPAGFDILPPAQKSAIVENAAGPPAAALMSALPPLISKDTTATNQVEVPHNKTVSFESNNPYSLLAVGSNKTTPLYYDSKETFLSVATREPMKNGRVVSGSSSNNNNGGGEIQQDHLRAKRIQKQQQVLSGGGSFFATSPRSFLMGSNSSAA